VHRCLAPVHDPATPIYDPAMTPLLRYLTDLHEAHLADRSGEVATYIPELADVDPELFGICIVMVDGTVYEVGDSYHRFTIQSMSKPLTYAMALDELGPDVVGGRIGLEPTGDAFNAISLDPVTGQATNAMVNAGAITAADLLHARHGEQALGHLLDGYSKFVGRPLSVDRQVAESERVTGHRNRAIAHLLRGAGSMGDDVESSLQLYFDQCSVEVDCHDLGVMAATLANGGRNPIDGVVAVTQPTARHVLAVMASCGMYDGAGRWIVSVGLPAKSGVSGGIVAVLPGQLGVAVFSPRLDSHGNSVRGVNVCRELAGSLGLHLVNSGRRGANRAPTLRTLADGGSRRKRSPDAIEQLRAMGDQVLAIVLRGDIQFADAEHAVRSLVSAQAAAARPARFVIVDLARTGIIHEALPRLLRPVATELVDRGGMLVVAGIDDDFSVAALHQFAESVAAVHISGTLNDGFEWCEDQLLRP
jgi:glutaminase